jgi:hypothetical protein
VTTEHCSRPEISSRSAASSRLYNDGIRLVERMPSDTNFMVPIVEALKAEMMRSSRRISDRRPHGMIHDIVVK